MTSHGDISSRCVCHRDMLKFSFVSLQCRDAAVCIIWSSFFTNIAVDALPRPQSPRGLQPLDSYLTFLNVDMTRLVEYNF